MLLVDMMKIIFVAVIVVGFAQIETIHQNSVQNVAIV